MLPLEDVAPSIRFWSSEAEETLSEPGTTGGYGGNSGAGGDGGKGANGGDSCGNDGGNLVGGAKIDRTSVQHLVHEHWIAVNWLHVRLALK